MNRSAFFAGVKADPFNGRLSQASVDGMTAILDEWDKRKLTDLRWLAYILATVRGECGANMLPVREGFSKSDAAARAYVKKKGYKYAKVINGHVYYGRGLVQLTWFENYDAMGELLDIDLANNPDRALEPKIAAAIIFEGMIRGTFTGGKHKLANYFHGTSADWKNARRIVNGTDKAATFADWGKDFYVALQSASVGAKPAKPLPPARVPEGEPEIIAEAEPIESLELIKGVAERAQELLKEKGWYADGLVDDDAGPRTQAAILAFRNENGLPLKNTIDDEFMAALEAAPPRYIPPERAEMTVTDMMAKDTTVAEPLRQNWWQKLVAWVVAIPSVIAAAFSGIMDFFGEATSKLDPLKAILSDVPVWVWFGLAAGVALTIWLGARRSDKNLADMTRTGKIA